MKRCQVELTGHLFDLEDVFENQTAESWSVVKDDDKYYLESSLFKGIEEVGDVRDIAPRIITLINGSAKLRIPGFRPIEPSNVSFIDDNGKRHRFVLIQGSISGRSRIRASATVIGPDGTEVMKDAYQTDRIEPAFSLAISDENVSDALRLYSINELGWGELYKIFEIIRADVGGSEELNSREYVLKKDIRNFSHTAQHPGAIGDDARHARIATDVPANPMSLAEATLFISTMLNKWIDSKLSGL